MYKKIMFLCLTFLVILVTMSFASGYNMTYIYGGMVDTQISNVNKTNGIIDEVSPSYFDLNVDGSLKITDAVSTKIISKMHDMNIKVVPFLSNHWDRQLGRIALENREELANEIVYAINKYNLDGINVDIENVTEIDKDNYTDLVRMLREKLAQEKIVAVAVCANPKGWIAGWHGSYDYEKLANYSDYLMIMAYDEHYQGGTSGPVASYDFVEESIKYALKYVDSDKLVLGLPFFGRYWNEENKGGRGVSLKLVDQILADYNSVGTYDEETKSMKAIINVSKEQALNDKYIFEAGTYTFWYENSKTIEKKINLVKKYNLKGTGSWSLGQELSSLWDEEFWNYYDDNVDEIIEKNNDNIEDKKIFNDVEKSRWSYRYINFVYDCKIMIGNNDMFRPSYKLTRAEAVTIIDRLIKYKNIKCELEKSDIDLSDINDSWAYKEICNCVNYGLIKGYEDGTFRPNENITREEIIVILDRMNIDKEDINSNIDLCDINSSMWSYNSIINSISKGLIKGYEDNTFRPKQNITREEISTIIYDICK